MTQHGGGGDRVGSPGYASTSERRRLIAPVGLTALRCVIGPVMVVLAYADAQPRWVLVLLLSVGVLSDVFDGIIARRLGVSFAWVRRFDSFADVIFWLCTAWTAAVLEPEVMWSLRWAIASLILLEVACHALSRWRFGKSPCTHGYLAKLWGLTLWGAFVSVIGFGIAGPVFWLMFVVGVVADVEVLVVVMLLPEWRHDVSSVFRAIRLRREKMNRDGR